MSDAPAPKRTRALVLGGGGPVGVAWELGLAAGLASGGVDLTLADKVVGTSAGSITGAMLTGGDDPAVLAAEVEQMFTQGIGDSGADQVPAAGVGAFMDLMLGSATSGLDPAEFGRRAGKLALETPTIPEEAFVGSIGSVLAGRPWPAGFECTAVDTATGEFKVWSAESNVPLERAIASSCSVPGIYPPVTIDGSRYMDGGVRSALNAELGTGHDAVIVVSVMPMELPPGIDDPRISAFLGAQQAEVDALRASGAAVEVIVPDMDFLMITGFGLNLMDFSIVGAAAEVGTKLGKSEAERLSAMW